MPSEPKLITALEVRLTNFEKQLKEAGLIADREVKNIEEKFSRANPQFAATFLGSFLGNVAAQGFSKLIGFIEDLVARFRDLEKVSKLVNIEMNDLFGLQEAGAKLGAPIAEITQSVRNLATLLDQMKRGEENSLSKLLDANPQALKGVNRDALTLQQTLEIVADLVKNARSEIQKIDLAKAAGQAETMVPLLEKGGAAVAKLQKAAADSAPDLQNLANQAKAFDEAWNLAIRNLKAYIIGDFVDTIRDKLLELIDMGVKFGTSLQGGIFEGGLLEGPAARATEKWKALREEISKTANFAERFVGEGPASARILVSPLSGNVPGGGTTTRNPNAPLSNVPLRTVEGSDRDRFDSATERIERRTRVMEAEAAAMHLGTEARERAKISEELLTIAMQVNGTVSEENRAKIEGLAAAYGRAAVAIEQARSPLATFARESADIGKALNQFAASSLNGMTDALADVVTGAKSAKDAFKALADAIIRDLARIAIRQAITGPIASALMGGGGLGGLFGGGGGASGAPLIYAPGNASGTDNWRGGPTWVGERGPELLNLPSGSQVIPNDVARNMGGGGSSPIVLNIIEDSSRAGQVDRGGDGGNTISAYVDRIMAENIARPGSATSNTLRSAGVSQPLARR